MQVRKGQPNIFATYYPSLDWVGWCSTTHSKKFHKYLVGIKDYDLEENPSDDFICLFSKLEADKIIREKQIWQKSVYKRKYHKWVVIKVPEES